MTEISATDVAQFKATARAAFSGGDGTKDVRKQMSTADGWNTELWQRISHDLEPAGLMLSTKHGGSELSATELAYLLEESGGSLFCSPLFATAGLAVPLLIALDDENMLNTYGPALSSGELTATVALSEDDGRWGTQKVATTASRTSDGWRINGSKNYVVDGATADLALVVARTDKGVSVFAVDHDASGLTAQPLVTMDQTRKMARLEFTDVVATRIGPTDAATAIDQAAHVSRALLAAEQVGGAQRCLDMAVEYAKTRIQFGRPIGAFQAIKQRLADMLIQVESGRSAAYAAARAASDDDPELPAIARVAALTATEAFNYVSAQNIQLHGGIGFTWEHDAHLYFKRARSSALILGTEDDHLEALAVILDAEFA